MKTNTALMTTGVIFMSARFLTLFLSSVDATVVGFLFFNVQLRRTLTTITAETRTYNVTCDCCCHDCSAMLHALYEVRKADNFHEFFFITNNALPTHFELYPVSYLLRVPSVPPTCRLLVFEYFHHFDTFLCVR